MFHRISRDSWTPLPVSDLVRSLITSLKHGYITTEELTTIYGYQHPPRAARDVRDHGIPLDTFRVKSSDGRTIGAYRFGDLPLIESGRFQGRIPFPKRLKNLLGSEQGSTCAVCSTEWELRYLQIDHRVPYAVVGDAEFDPLDLRTEEFMLLCGSCNRSKSWSCEHCQNFRELLDPSVCECCYWVSPCDYSHVALSQTRRLSIVWEGGDVEVYDLLLVAAESAGVDPGGFAKSAIKKALQDGDVT